MTRKEMIDNLLDSYTTRELKALATKLDIDHLNENLFPVNIRDRISDKLFDPGGRHEEFNKLAEMEQ